MKRALLSVCVVSLVIAGATSSALAAGTEEAAKEVMARAYEQWKAFAARDVDKAMSQVADDYTEFNPTLATRVDGKAMAVRMAKASDLDVSEGVLAEMLNPHVQFYGDVAILSYNYHGMTKGENGTVEPNRAKSTRVYVKQNGKWMLVHANFGADPIND